MGRIMILWLSDGKVSQKMRAVISARLADAGCKDYRMITINLSDYVESLNGISQTKKTAKAKAEKANVISVAKKALTELVDRLVPTVVVCTCEDVLYVVTGKRYSLAATCGSLYWLYNKAGKKIPLIAALPPVYLFRGGDFQYMTINAFGKIARFANGCPKKQPAFSYTLCESIQDVRTCCREAMQAEFMALDCETNGRRLSCLGHTYMLADGTVKTFVIPLVDKRRTDNNFRFWAPEYEQEIHELVRYLYASDSIKVMQNGWYDSAYFVRDGIPPVNYLLDLMNMQHAMFCEAPKKLGILAAVYLDFCTYWKDDIKGEKEAGLKVDETAYRTYWRYNGLDTYYTLLVGFEMLKEFKSHKYAYANYNTTFHLSIGPCFEAAMTGIKIDYMKWHKSIDAASKEADAAKASLCRLVGQGFNPGSSEQVGYFMYDFMQCPQTRLQKRMPRKYGARSTDKKVLKLIREFNNPFMDNFLDRLERYKKPCSILSYFGSWNKFTYEGKGRVLEWLNPCGTETGRMSSTHSQFWCGGNGQNITGKLREWFHADKDYVLLDIDYSASDDRWVAYEAEDPVKIDLVESDKDPHCFHASMYFAIDYEKLKAGHDNEEAWVEDPETGIRNITKKIGHGKNYDAQAATIYDLMGRKATVHAAITMGYKDAASWLTDRCIEFVAEICAKYDDPICGIYKRLKPWRREIVQKAVSTQGLVVNAFGFGRQFLGDLLDSGTQRELAAFYGQGDTAGNANRALREIYFGGVCNVNCRFVKQVHDSFVFQIHKSCIDESVQRIKQIMEKPTIVHGRSVKIPADAKVGIYWGKHMMSWKPGVTFEQIKQHDLDRYGSLPGIYAGESREISLLARVEDDTIDFGQLMADLSNADVGEPVAKYSDADIDDLFEED